MKKRFKQIATAVGFWFLGFTEEKGYTPVSIGETNKHYQIQVQYRKVLRSRNRKKETLTESLEAAANYRRQLEKLLSLIEQPTE